MRIQNIGNFHRTVQDIAKMHLGSSKSRQQHQRTATTAYCIITFDFSVGEWGFLKLVAAVLWYCCYYDDDDSSFHIIQIRLWATILYQINSIILHQSIAEENVNLDAICLPARNASSCFFPQREREEQNFGIHSSQLYGL